MKINFPQIRQEKPYSGLRGKLLSEANMFASPALRDPENRDLLAKNCLRRRRFQKCQ